jgi:hypothetical protein
MAAATKKEKKSRSLPLEDWRITNLKQSILETFDIYGFNSFIQERIKLALIQENQLDNTLASTQVKLIGEGFQHEIRMGGTININLKVCSKRFYKM